MILFVSALAAAAAFFAVKSGHTINKKTISFAKSYASWTFLLAEKSIAEIKNNEILKFQIMLSFASVLFFMLTGLFLILVLFVPAILLSPRIYIKNKKRLYEKDYYKNMPSMLESLISSLKSGLSITSAIKEYASSGKGACAREMQTVVKKTELGISIKDAMNSLAEAVPLPENLIFIDAVVTSVETGGSLSEVLSGVLSTLRARDEINREVSALTSQGVLSGIIVGAMPLILVGIVNFLDPEFMKPLFETKQGKVILVIAFFMELTGALLIKKITEIK